MLFLCDQTNLDISAALRLADYVAVHRTQKNVLLIEEDLGTEDELHSALLSVMSQGGGRRIHVAVVAGCLPVACALYTSCSLSDNGKL